LTHKKSTGLLKAARQEEIWKHQAFVEGVQEAQRANKIKRKDPELAHELNWDSRIAFKWANRRTKRVSMLTREANNLHRKGK